MIVNQADYEELLAEYSDYLGAIALLKEFRPYLEMIPSMRRPEESVITVPLPLVRIRGAKSAATGETSEVLRLPCDVAILMCDPEWKIKTGGDILVFIHRPSEDFSDFLGRWRQTQICLNKGYEWLMPDQYQHILSEAAAETYPLFVIFPETPERIKRGLRGASLPFVTQAVYSEDEFALSPVSSSSATAETEE
ncbi:MAG: hypothetical protein LH679_18425 [Cyanobacteria bacterium CAN_BIN43]|nr:hypothetical protein [Cyanobacteria bacterium CAN_BIN43]